MMGKTLGKTLDKAKVDNDANAIHLMHTANVIRSELFSNSTEFNGAFNEHCQNATIPPTLLTLVNMMLEGPANFESSDNQAALSIAQLIIFNAVKRARRTCSSDARHHSTIIRHSHSQETPLPLYMGMMLHNATRKAKLVDKCFKLGLSVSYQRVIQLSNKVTNAVCEKYRSDNFVCPPALRRELFSVAAVDNIDHNLSSTTATSSFHGTAISIIQFPTFENSGVQRSIIQDLTSSSDNISSVVLPLAYSDVPPCILPAGDYALPSVQVEKVVTSGVDVIASETEWLNRVCNSIENSPCEPINVTWAGCHADICTHIPHPPPIIAMLPMFQHSAHTAAMIRHSLTVVAQAVQHVNPSQIPVVTYDH